MRLLTYSLIAVVLFATVGLGWLFDEMYDQYAAQEQSRDVDKVKLLEQLGTGLANTLNGMPERAEFIQRWHTQQQQNTYQIGLMAIADFPIPEALLNQIKRGEALLLESDNDLTFHYYLTASHEILTLKTAIDNISPSEKPVNYLFTILFYAALILLFLVWVYPLARQLLRLRKASQSFGEGNLTQRIELSSISYIRDIEIEFNHMAQRIEDLITDVKMLGSAVSHDLRTPLARIQFGIDTLQEEDDPILRRRYERKISDNVTQMTSLVETLLQYARLDQTMLEMNKKSVDLSSLLQLCIQRVENEELEITYTGPKDKVMVVADINYISMLLNNLLQNAVIYGQGKILVNLLAQQNNAQIIIADNGQGIAIEQRENVFKPFFRGKKNQANIKGHGIGLAIVKRILDWHQGEIEVGDSAELSGAQFVVTLPAET